MPRQTKSFKERAISVLEKAERLKKTERTHTTWERAPDRGDRLARGAFSATFRMPDVGQERWDKIFLPDKEFKKKYHAKKEK
jgi:hypothetical protein